MSGQIREIAEKFAHEYNYSFDPDLYLEDQIEQAILTALAAVLGEPVAWMFTNEEGDDDFGNNYIALKDKEHNGGPIVPLYSAELLRSVQEMRG